MKTRTLFLMSGLAVILPCAAGQDSGAAVDAYSSQIKPLLKERCFACHGALQQESGLRVDTVAAMIDHGIVNNNELLSRLTSTEEGHRMPPEGERLTGRQMKVIRLWLAAGTPAPENEKPEAHPDGHWAFQKIERPAVPESNEANPIDAFLALSQKQNGLKTQNPAVKSLLLRRLYLDIIGLPPTTAQMQSADTIDTIIDSLLASPQYGERWGRHWMDVWRYSDWYGLGSELRNSQKHIWHWRDWIIDSLNGDKGYDRMITEMLAGDEIAPDDLQTIAATGFLARNYYLFNRTTWLDNTIEHTAKAFLGLTMNCAKCHDHKYDPIGHEDYYRFRAVFEPHHVRLDALPGETDYRKNALPRVYDDQPDAPTYLHLRGNPAQPVEDELITAGPPQFLASFAAPADSIDLPVNSWAPGTRRYVQSDQLADAEASVELAGKALKKAEVKQKQSAAATVAGDAGIAFSDDFSRMRQDIWDTFGKGWRYQGGLLSQTEPTIDRSCLRTKFHHPNDFSLTLKFQTTGGEKWMSTGIRFDVDDAGDNAHTVYVSAFAGGPKVQLSHTQAGKSVYPPIAKADRPIQLNREYELNVKARTDLVNVALDGKFLFAYQLPRRQAGAIELFAFDSAADFYSLDVATLADGVVLKQPANRIEPGDSATLVKLAEAQLHLAKAKLSALKSRIDLDNATFRNNNVEPSSNAGRLILQVKIAQAEVDLLQSDEAGKTDAARRIDQATAALKSGTFPAHEPLRGSQRALNQKSNKAADFSPVYAKISTGRRTALAHWITHRDNPLTARVAVNHIWLRHFGTPLADSVFDFGRRTSKPLHAELLDFLAVELMESGWSMKHIHRLILTSKAWQRSSSNLNADPQTFVKDSGNRFYWRMNGRRMESQLIRDSLLHLAGKLDLTRGGPPVKPAADVRRRSLYLFHARDGRDRFLSTFDDADVFACYRRSESIVPQQALAMMNSREAIQAAGDINAVFDEALAVSEFAQACFLLILARLPSEQEMQVCVEFLTQNPDRIHYIHGLLNHNDFQVIR